MFPLPWVWTFLYCAVRRHSVVSVYQSEWRHILVYRKFNIKLFTSTRTFYEESLTYINFDERTIWIPSKQRLPHLTPALSIRHRASCLRTALPQTLSGLTQQLTSGNVRRMSNFAQVGIYWRPYVGPTCVRTQANPAKIQILAHWNITGLSMISPLHVLPPGSILPPFLSHCTLFPARKILHALIFFNFLLFKFCSVMMISWRETA